MNKFMKICSALAVSICFMLALVSCKSETFYNEWSAAGAKIEEKNCFKLLTVDEVVAKREAKENFVIFIGASALQTTTNQTAVDKVSEIQAEADAVDYTDYVYFVNAKDAMLSLTEQKNMKEKLKVNEISDSYGLVCVSYIKGDVYFDTSAIKGNNVPDNLKRFVVEGSQISFKALANYVFENYPVTE